MEVSQFTEEIISSDRKPFYLIRGGDPEAVGTCLLTAQKAVNQDFFTFNYRSFRTQETDWNQIMEDAVTSPFFLPPKIVVIQRDKYLASELEQLSRYLEKPNADNTLIILLDSEEKHKFFKEVQEQGLEVDCQVPAKNEMPDWLVRQMAKKGMTLTRDGAKAMLDRLGDNLALLLTEVEKLSIHPGPSVRLTPKEIKELVSLGPTAILYELGEPLANQKVGEALDTLLDLAEKASPMALIYTIGTHFLRLLKFKFNLEAANPESLTAARPLGLHPYFFEIMSGQARKWSWAQLSAAVGAIVKAHRTIITASTPPEIVLEELAVFLGTYLKGAQQ